MNPRGPLSLRRLNRKAAGIAFAATIGFNVIVYVALCCFGNNFGAGYPRHIARAIGIASLVIDGPGLIVWAVFERLARASNVGILGVWLTITTLFSAVFWALVFGFLRRNRKAASASTAA